MWRETLPLRRLFLLPETGVARMVRFVRVIRRGELPNDPRSISDPCPHDCQRDGEMPIATRSTLEAPPAYLIGEGRCIFRKNHGQSRSSD